MLNFLYQLIEITNYVAIDFQITKNKFKKAHIKFYDLLLKASNAECVNLIAYQYLKLNSLIC